MKFSNLLPDLPCSQSYLAEAFQKQHERYLETFPGWSLYGTRRKLATFYWFKIVLKHYLILLVIGSLFVCLCSQQPAQFIFRAFLPASILVFAVLFVFMY